jgi:predicted nuclease of predicted toxin-antitoxin system
MRILFDQGTPAPLRHALSHHSVSTAYEMAWAQLSNGALPNVAEAQFDVLITTDQNLRYQQSVARSRLAILILPTTNWPKLRAHQALVAAAVERLSPGDVVELNFT